MSMHLPASASSNELFGVQSGTSCTPGGSVATGGCADTTGGCADTSGVRIAVVVVACVGAT